MTNKKNTCGLSVPRVRVTHAKGRKKSAWPIVAKATTAPIAKPEGYRPILSAENAKTSKGEKLGYRTGICYMAPAKSSGFVNMCEFAVTCPDVCLAFGGRGKFDSVWNARLAKTKLFVENRAHFLACLRYDIVQLVRYCERRAITPCVRVNGTSDRADLALTVAREFTTVQFYDYSKLPKPELRTLPNYHITFSFDGVNLAESLRVLALGVNVAVVFPVKKGEPLPVEWNGYQVIDGDTHDLRFLDRRAVVVGLRAKGPAIGSTCGFVVPSVQPLIQLVA